MVSFLQSATNALVDLLFPPQCLHCQASIYDQKHLLCPDCNLQLPYLHPLDAHEEIRTKLVEFPQLCQAFSFMQFQKQGVSQSLLHEIKYRGNYPVAEILGQWFGHKIVEEIQSFDALCPVPLHPTRQRKRGYNQSHHICLGLQKASDLPIKNYLKRVRKSRSQTKKSREERFLQMERMFQLKNDEALAGQKILLVDDVLTTGATSLACLKLLHASGADVGLLTLALA